MDTLTKLPNHAAFRDDWEAGKYRHHCLLLLDIDLFMAYNDWFGHDAGDVALKKITSVLTDVAKRYDGIVYRIGGADFILVAPNQESLNPQALANEAQIAVHNLRIPFEHSGVRAKHEDYLTISIGVVRAEHTDTQSFKEIGERADKAKCNAKMQRPGGISFWSKEETLDGVS